MGDGRMGSQKELLISMGVVDVGKPAEMRDEDPASILKLTYRLVIR